MAADDLTLVPDFVVEEQIKFNTQISRMENGTEQRRALWATPLRKFKLEFSNRVKADMETLVALYEAKLGAYDSFLWTNPNDSVQYTVRFEEDTLTTKLKAFEIYDLSCSLIQVR